MFSTVESQVTKSGRALGLFKKDWHDIVYDMKNTQGFSNKLRAAFSNTISQTDIENIRKYNTAINNGVTSQTAFNQYLRHSSASAQNLAASANGAAVSQQALTQATQKLTLAQKASAVASKALGTALNLALNVGFMLIINAIITGITKLVNKQKELREEIQANADEARETIKNISDLYLEYRQLSEDVKTNADLKDDLSNTTYSLLEALGYEKSQIDELTAGYQNLDDAINQATLDSLKKATDSLNLDVGVKFEELQDVFQDKLFSTADDDMYIFSTWNPWNEQRSQNKKMFQALSEADLENVDIGRGINYEELLVGGHEKTLDDFKKTAETYAKILEILRNNSGVSAEELGKNDLFIKIKSRYDDLTTAIDNYSSSVKDYNNNIAQQTVLTSLIGKDIPKTSEEFEKFKETLVSSAQNSNQFIGSAEEIEQSIISVLKTMPEFANFFTSTDLATKSIYDFQTATKDLSEALDGTFKAQSTIQSAFDKIAEGTALSAEEVRELIAIYPALADGFTKTVDGYTIDSQRLIEANSDMVADTKKSYEERIQYLKDFINTPFDTSDISSEAEARMYQTWAENVESAKTELSELELVLSMLGITTSSTTTEFDKLSKTVSEFTSNQKTLNDALEEQKEHGQLSASTIQSLTEAGYAQALAIDAETGAVTLNVAVYERLNEQKREEIRLDAEKQKSELFKQLQNEKKIIEELGKAYADANKERKEAILLEMEQHGATYNDIEARISQITGELASLDAPEWDGGKEEVPDEIKKYLDAYEKYNHEINIGLKAKDQEYFDWVATEAEKAYSKYPKYLEDLWKYQEEVYEGRKQLADDYLNDRIEDREAQIEITLDTSKADDGTKLNTKEKFDYVRDCYKEILAEIETRINDLIQSGVATNSEAIQELEKQAQEYRDKLDGVLTDEIETEIDYLKNMQDEWDKVYDSKIDAIEKEKSAMEERYDSEIEALQKANDEKQKEYDIEKARQELAKAEQRTRMVIGADGRRTYEQDTEAVAEAQKNLDDLLVKKQIEALEEQKALETKKFEEEIERQKQEQKAKKDFYTKLLEILENYLNPKATESNSNVWESVLGDTENVKKSNGNVEVKGVDVDTSSLKKGILNSVDIATWLEKLGASLEVIQSYIDGNGSTTTIAMQTSMNNTASKQFDNQHKTSAWSASRDDYKLASANQNENVTYAIGDIHIHNPVGNSNDLAAEFAKHLTLAIHKQTYTNLKK